MKKIPLWSGVPPLWPQGLNEDYPVLEMDENVPDDVPFILVCPGGGYHHLAAHEGGPVAEVFRNFGYAVGVLYYRVTRGQATEPLRTGPLLDVQRAIRLVRGEIGEKRKVVVLGFSAGGHLAASAGVYHSPVEHHPVDELAGIPTRPDAMILCYPVISARAKANQGSLISLCGPHDEADLRSFYCLEERAGEQTPPAFMWHTFDDASVPVENVLYFSETLSRFKIPFELHIFPHGRHGLGLAPENKPVAVWPELARVWLRGVV